MPFTFRRSKKIAPGVRANLGKRGVSLSLGGKRAGVTVGRRGVSQRVRIGKGLGFRTKAQGCALLLLMPLLLLALGTWWGRGG